MIQVADLADGRHALHLHPANLPEGSLSSARPLSRETNCACEPAERAICPPLPGFNSMLCTMVPAGIFSSGSALPSRMSASGTAHHLLPDFHTVGLQDVAFSPST